MVRSNLVQSIRQGQATFVFAELLQRGIGADDPVRQLLTAAIETNSTELSLFLLEKCTHEYFSYEALRALYEYEQKTTTFLNAAIDHGNVSIVDRLLKSMDYSNNNKLNGLTRAVQNNDEEIVLCILRSNVIVDEEDNDVRFPIRQAAEIGNVALVKLLMDSGFAITEDVLLKAVESEHEDVIKFIKKSCCEPFYPVGTSTALVYSAIDLNNVVILKMLLEMEAAYHFSESWHKSPLHYAIVRRRYECMQLLLERYEADACSVDFTISSPNIDCPSDITELTPIQVAAFLNDPTAIEMLESFGGNVHQKVKTILSLTIQSDGESVKYRIYPEGTLLHLAAYGVRGCGAVSYLLEADIALDATDTRGNTALHIASVYNNVEFLRTISELDEIHNMRNTNGQTLLCSAIMTNALKVARVLIESKCGINEKGFDGNTPLMYAVMLQQKGLVAMLCRAGADLDVRNNEGVTALCIAVMKVNHEIVTQLAQSGASVNVSDNNGYTPLHLAFSEHDDFSIAEILLTHGADTSVIKDDDIVFWEKLLDKKEKIQNFLVEYNARKDNNNT